MFRQYLCGIVTLMVIMPGSLHAADEQGVPEKRRFRFSARDVRKSYGASRDEEKSKKLEAQVLIEFPMEERYWPPAGSGFFLSYYWHQTWDDIQGSLERGTGLAKERQFLYSSEGKQIASLPEFYRCLKNVKKKTVRLRDKPLAVKVLRPIIDPKSKRHAQIFQWLDLPAPKPPLLEIPKDD